MLSGSEIHEQFVNHKEMLVSVEGEPYTEADTKESSWTLTLHFREIACLVTEYRYDSFGWAVAEIRLMDRPLGGEIFTCSVLYSILPYKNV